MFGEDGWVTRENCIDFIGITELDEQILLGSNIFLVLFYSEQISQSQTETCDMIAIGITCHGRMRENLLEIVLSDGECIAVESLLEPIYTCQNLVHKPKIIVLNVCRGSHNLGQGEILEAAQDRRGARVHQLKVSVNLIF